MEWNQSGDESGDENLPLPCKHFYLFHSTQTVKVCKLINFQGLFLGNKVFLRITAVFQLVDEVIIIGLLHRTEFGFCHLYFRSFYDELWVIMLCSCCLGPGRTFDPVQAVSCWHQLQLNMK